MLNRTKVIIVNLSDLCDIPCIFNYLNFTILVQLYVYYICSTKWVYFKSTPKK